MRNSGPPSRVEDVLQRVLQRVDPDKQLHAHTIWTFWDDEVGPTIARRAQPARFRNGILFVTVATHSWMQELQFVKDELRERLNQRLGSDLVRDIFFHTGTVEPPAETPEDAPPESVPEAHLVPLPAIADGKLADAFARLLQARAKRLGGTRARTPRRRKR
jgi:hypothetical protein